MQNRPVARMTGHVDEVLAGRKPTSRGSSDTDVNDPIARPTGSSGPAAVTTTTGVGT
jgi:hypothetical protein